MNLEVNVQSVEYINWNLANQVLNHLNVGIPFVFVFCGFWTNLDSCRIKGSVLVLETTHKYYMLEPSKAFIFTELVEGGFFKVFIVSHTELTETSALPPLLDQPHPRIEKFPTLVQVTKVGRAQTKIPMHLVFEIFQVRESSSYNQATK